MLYLHADSNQAFLYTMNEKSSQVSLRQESANMLAVVRPKPLPEIWVKMADARAHWVVNGGEIV